jgi:hypothetical protein
MLCGGSRHFENAANVYIYLLYILLQREEVSFELKLIGI